MIGPPSVPVNTALLSISSDRIVRVRMTGRSYEQRGELQGQSDKNMTDKKIGTVMRSIILSRFFCPSYFCQTVPEVAPVPQVPAVPDPTPKGMSLSRY
jgi:hypothetical protein